jgi:hypothetical protein
VQTLDLLRELSGPNRGIVTRRQARAAGVHGRSLTTLVRRGLIARLARGVYAVRDSAQTALDPHAITAGWLVVLSYESAAAWWGIHLPAPVGRLHVTAPRTRSRRRDGTPGVKLHRATLRPGDVVTLRGLRVTSPLRTAVDIARRSSVEHGTTVVDSFYRARLFTPAEFHAAADRAKGPGRVPLQLVARLADPGSGSVLETRTRILLWRHQIAPECTQYSLSHPKTGWIGYLDFAWPGRRVALECDGYEWHADREPFQKDRRRWSALNRANWKSGVVTWFDVLDDPAYVVALVRDLLAVPFPNTNVTAAYA